MEGPLSTGPTPPSFYIYNLVSFIIIVKGEIDYFTVEIKSDKLWEIMMD